MGILAKYTLTKDEILRRTMKYILMFLLTFLVCFHIPKTTIQNEDIMTISFIMSCCLVILDLYFPIIKINKEKIDEKTDKKINGEIK